MIGFALAALLAAASTFCEPDRAGYCSDTVIDVPLTYAEPDVRLNLNVVVGDALVIQLEEPIAIEAGPAMGNEAAFKIARPEGGRHIMVWPQLGKSARGIASSVGAASNLHVMLKSGINILISLRVVNAASGAQRVNFTFPELVREFKRDEARWAAKRAELEQERATLKESLAAKADLYGLDPI